MRQPPPAISAGVNVLVMMKAAEAATNTARPWLASCQAPKKPRRSLGASSASSVVDAPTSPPAENPCSRRPRRMTTAPNTPAVP